MLRIYDERCRAKVNGNVHISFMSQVSEWDCANTGTKVGAKPCVKGEAKTQFNPIFLCHSTAVKLKLPPKLKSRTVILSS